MRPSGSSAASPYSSIASNSPSSRSESISLMRCSRASRLVISMLPLPAPVDPRQPHGGRRLEPMQPRLELGERPGLELLPVIEAGQRERPVDVLEVAKRPRRPLAAGRQLDGLAQDHRGGTDLALAIASLQIGQVVADH